MTCGSSRRASTAQAYVIAIAVDRVFEMMEIGDLLGSAWIRLLRGTRFLLEGYGC